ncbi:hypothetical protein A3E44_04875 [Candidatus Woesebacteria bacterium RIFCSPHIGHO2_12_FULL_41_24]|uniref:Uncharacterized protein n=1 Tax=Candidatus Woesebacteria bacterium RIFCSPHIGHO2_12_FULL_41_24 TaxID=1802510 RepID=A0A1F8AWD5_9BACT|nr:MAG: hypothetical protein A2W15_00150 [Candidatus Woesebacteria bacterium RBG_16_41_13]OGM55568.1 MAG: hypothetical protein A3E44_04875 [Candidatus Woesebacteria bacterium RIFCSPHIGHO2_12_FULL_41_24]OGM67356.1 MAG: hypothetical protein A2969_02840 [Candidatus Woesebacteria bacterium RIFCSPLOWO2_01_FULL_42_67]
MSFPPSTEFLAKRSGCQLKIAFASPFSIFWMTSSKTGLPKFLAVRDSVKKQTTCNFSLAANSFSSSI